MRRIAFALAAALPLAACAGGSGPGTLTPAREAAIAAEIRAEAQKFGDALTTRNADALAALFSDAPDFRYLNNGNRLDKPGVMGVARNFFTNARNISGRWIGPTEVVVLGPDAATFWGLFRADENAVMNNGQPVWAVEGKPGAQLWSFAYRRNDAGRWEIVHAHQTALPAGRFDQYR